MLATPSVPSTGVGHDGMQGVGPAAVRGLQPSTAPFARVGDGVAPRERGRCLARLRHVFLSCFRLDSAPLQRCLAPPVLCGHVVACGAWSGFECALIGGTTTASSQTLFSQPPCLLVSYGVVGVTTRRIIAQPVVAKPLDALLGQLGDPRPKRSQGVLGLPPSDVPPRLVCGTHSLFGCFRPLRIVRPRVRMYR